MLCFALILTAFQGSPADTLWTEETEHYSITVSYPEIALENPAIGDLLEEYAQGQVDNFVRQFKEYELFDPLASEWYLELDFVLQESPDGMICILAWVWDYSGGAHGNSMTQSFNFDLNTGETIGVVELLGGQKQFEAFAAEVISSLKGDQFYDQGWVERGASSDLQNYHTVFPVPDENGGISGYTVLFPPYQVDCYASGTIEVYIPAE